MSESANASDHIRSEMDGLPRELRKQPMMDATLPVAVLSEPAKKRFKAVALLLGICVFASVIAIFPHGLSAQEPAAAVPTAPFTLPPTGPVREREPLSSFQGFLEDALPLNPQRLRVSGELREQYESWCNREFGLAEDADNDYLLQRVYLSFESQPADWLSTLAELGSSFQFGSSFEPSPIDEDPVYFQQLFANTTLLESQAGRLSATFGRQVFSLGSGRLVAIRNGPNIRRSFDAVRLQFDSAPVAWQLLCGSDVEFGGDGFDNEPRTDRLLWGSYHTFKAGPESLLPGNGGLDLYYLGYRNRDAEFDSASGDERRHSFGARAFGLFGNGNRWDYNIEPVVQFGSIGDQQIQAYTVANVLGYTFRAAPMEPRLGLKFDIISGDRDRNDGRLETFNAYFPNNSYFSEAAIFAPANLYDLNLNAELQLFETLRLVMLWDFLWRYSNSDAIYVPPGRPAFPGNSSDRRFIGDTISLATEWKPTPAIEPVWHMFTWNPARPSIPLVVIRQTFS